LPKEISKRRSPTALLEALKRAGRCSDIGYEWTRETIDICNKCAHCIPVDARLVRTSIAMWHNAIDNDPCGEPQERVAHCKPQTEGYDVDDCDDDHGDDWKIGGAA